MANPQTEVVIAGTKAFALALLAPLTERVGTRPRITADPGQALSLCKGGSLVVMEFQGEGSLRAIQTLMVQQPSVRVVAAVPAVHAAAEGALGALGVELARWDGKPAPVLEAVGRQLGDAPEEAPSDPFAGPPSPPVPVTSPVPVPAAPPRAAVSASLFDDIGPMAEGPAAGDLAGLAAASPSFVPGDATWPGNVPSGLEAAEALARGLAGDFDPPGSPLASVRDVVTGLTELERSVFAGAAEPIDTEPIRRAAVMRVRVAAALAIAPPPGTPVDSAAVSALLAEIDALLAKVNALAQSTPPELQAAVEQVRNSLVKEAIDFSEAAHGRAEDAPPASRPGAPAATRRAEHTRIVSVDSRAETELERAQQRRSVKLIAVLAALGLVAGGFHGWRWWSRRPRADDERLRRVGAPLDAEAVVSTPGAPILVRSKTGRPFTADELRRIEETETLKGNRVVGIGPDRVVILEVPVGVKAAGSSGPAPAPPGAPPSPPLAPAPDAAPPPASPAPSR